MQMVVENKEPLWPSSCMSLDTSLPCMDCTLDSVAVCGVVEYADEAAAADIAEDIPNEESEVCCRPTSGLFMMTEWWLLGEPPPGTSSMMGASLLMFPLLWLMSKVEYPFSFLGMPSMETTTNHTSNSTISNTWRSSSATSLLPFSTILTPWRRQTWSGWDLALFLISYSGYSSFGCTCTRTHLLRVEDEMCALRFYSDGLWFRILIWKSQTQTTACLQPHQVQLGLRGEGALQEMLYWPPGVGEDRFLSCMVLPTVEVLMSLCTLAQVNNMATRDMSDRSVLHEMAPTELTSLQLFSSSTELSTSSAVLSSSLSMSTTPKPKIMKGAKATGLNLPRLLNLQVLFAMRSYPMDMGFLMLVMVRMMTLDLLQLLFDVPWT